MDWSFLQGEMSFADLEVKYKNFLAPTFEILIEQCNVIKREGIEIPGISVTTSVNAPGQFSFTVNNAFDGSDFRWMEQYFSVGRNVEIKAGYADRLSPLITGRITSVKINFPAGGAPTLEITGLDFLEPLMKNSQPNTFKGTHSEIVEKIVNNAYSGGVVRVKPIADPTAINYDHIEKGTISDFAFITALARENNFEFFLLGDEFYFRAAPKNKEKATRLEWGRNLISFSPEVNLAKQVAIVKVIGHDSQGRRYTGIAQEVDKDEKGDDKKSGSEMARDIYGDKAVLCIQSAVNSQQDADNKAKALLADRARELVTGRGECIGIPEIRAGKYLDLGKLGKAFSKNYYIKLATHTVSNAGYKTAFEVEANTL